LKRRAKVASFLVRVELHDADWDDYEQLHAQMADRGFCREIRGSDGRTYQLPTAEYVIQTGNGLENVRALAAAAAQATGRKFGVIAAEYSRSAWMGLAYA
jgi:hypothetical protein